MEKQNLFQEFDTEMFNGKDQPRKVVYKQARLSHSVPNISQEKVTAIR
jgi:hypothetical protein